MVCYFRASMFNSMFSKSVVLQPVQSLWAKSFVRDTKPLLLAATTASIVTFSDRPPPRAVLLPPPPRPPLPPRAPPRPRPGRPRSPKLISSWDVMSLAGLRKWWSLDSSDKSSFQPCNRYRDKPTYCVSTHNTNTPDDQRVLCRQRRLTFMYETFQDELHCTNTTLQL